MNRTNGWAYFELGGGGGTYKRAPEALTCIGPGDICKIVILCIFAWNWGGLKPKGTNGRAFERSFGPGGAGIWTSQSSKVQMPGWLPGVGGVMLKLRGYWSANNRRHLLDTYIGHFEKFFNVLNRPFLEYIRLERSNKCWTTGKNKASPFSRSFHGWLCIQNQQY